MAKPHHFGAILRIPINLQMFHSEDRWKNTEWQKKKTEDMKGKEKEKGKGEDEKEEKREGRERAYIQNKIRNSQNSEMFCD